MIDKSNYEPKEFKELQGHPGSENYEVIAFFTKEYQKEYLSLDTDANRLILKAFNNPLNKKDFKSFALKMDFMGNQIDSSNTNRILKNGVDWYREEYSEWPTNGDKKKHPYIIPLSVKDKTNPQKWLEKFNELYTDSSYVYIFMSRYYFKIDNNWMMMENWAKVIDSNFKKQYPPKEDQDVRMVELENLAPVWYHKGFKDRDTSLIKMIDYESTYYEEKGGLDSYKYSAGWWYLEVYMPLGDTIRIKRYSYFEDPELKLYKVPKEYGGREDVLFIVQKPKDAHAEQVAGMYAIRPRDPNQPQRRYKKIVYKTDPEGNEIIDNSKSEETEEYKQWKKDKK